MADPIVLRPELREALERNSEDESRTIEDLVNEAVGLYVFRLQQKKIERETAAYELMHSSLRERFLGQWVAIHEGQLVDHDGDQMALYHRVRQQYGKTSVLIKQVRESPIEEIRLRTWSTGKRLP